MKYQVAVFDWHFLPLDWPVATGHGPCLIDVCHVGGIDTVLNRLEIRSISCIAGSSLIFIDLHDLHDLHPFYSYESELGTPRIGMVDD